MENTTSTTNWTETLSEDIRTSESLGKFKDINGLAKSYLELERSMGNRVSIPSQDASDDDWRGFYSKAGLPEDGKYIPTSARNKDNEEFLNHYEPTFHSLGLSKRQGENLIKKMIETSDNAQKQYKENLDKTRNEHLETINKKYGSNVEEKLKLVDAAIAKYGNQEILKVIDESNYNPHMIDMLVNVGSLLSGDALVTGNTKSTSLTKEDAIKEIARLESDKDFMTKYRNKGQNDSAVKQLNDLAECYGTCNDGPL